jgi:TonB family protein
MMTIAWKATAILVAAFCAAACLQGRSASLRHFTWTAALAALLILPAFSLVTPTWQPIANMLELRGSVSAVVAAGPAPAPEIPWLTILYVAGALAAAARFLVGALRTSWIVRHASASGLDAGTGVRVVASPHAPMPLAWGILRRVIVVPAAALKWPAPRVRAVLLHESMHHRRRDLLTQAIAQAACCLFWCHPLAWLALARQRRERERACDDAVLRHGIAAHEYATHLIDVVRCVASSRRKWSDAPAMAEASGLETRVRAVLDRDVDRRPLTRSAAVLVAAGTLFVLTAASVVNLRAQDTGGTITGVVEDPSGARVPGCKITAKNLNGSNEEVAVANAAGEYRFINIPPGRYVLEFGSRGFALRKIDADLVPNMVARVDARLEVGQTTESVQVSGRRLAPMATPQTARAPERIRVGGNITPLRLLRQTRPVYPPDLQQLGVEGTVVMRAVVSKDGAVLKPQVINSADPRLAKAAMDAVAQWQYQPSLLNGEPIETLTTISVDFHLEP